MMNYSKDLQQFHQDIKALSSNLALSNYLLCKAIASEPKLGVQPVVLQNLSLQNQLILTLQRALSDVEPLQKSFGTFEK